MSKKTDGLLTIIVPCYNAEKYLNRCFSSLASLNEKDITVLFVNDGSTDKTLQVLEHWAENRANVCIVSKENGGYATAINTGLDHCGSEYVMFMGVDDELVAEGIDRVCFDLREEHPDILTFSTVKYYDDAKEGGVQREIDSSTKYTKPGFYTMDAVALYRKLGCDAWILFSRDTSRCFKMTLLGELRYFGKTGVSADGCFASLAACKAKSFSFVNELCYLWHVHRDSVSGRSKTMEKLVEEAEVWAAFFAQIRMEFASIPDPIINHFFVYKKLIVALRAAGMTALAQEHEIGAKAFSTWALKSIPLSKKARFKLMFPKLFSFVLEMSK